MFEFICEKCGKRFYSKVDPSGWRHTVCNACSGKPYKDYPVPDNGSTEGTSYTPKPVPVKPVYNKPQEPVVKPEFNLEKYIGDMLEIYVTLKEMVDESKLNIPIENLCNWTTSIMIQKSKM